MATTRTEGSNRDNDRKSWVESPSRGEKFSARETFIGNDSSNPIPTTPLGRQSDGDLVENTADGVAVDLDDNAVSTSTPLGSGASYQSGWVDSDGFKSIEITIKADQLSAVDGIVVEFTNDANAVTPEMITQRVFTFTQSDLDNGSFNVYIPPRLDGFRITYTNGALAQANFFLEINLRTAPIQNVNVPIGTSIRESTNATIIRAVLSGETLDERLDPTGDYENAELTRNKSLKTQSVHETIFQYKTPDDAALPSGATITIDRMLNTEANVIDSGWILIKEFKVQDLHALADTPIKVYLLNASDDSGNNWQGATQPAIVTVAGFPANIAARFFDDYFRVVICNDSGSTANELTIRSTGGNSAIQPLDFSLNQTVFDFFPAPLTQTVLRTYNEGAGTLDLLQSSPSGSLQVAITDRPSEVRNRTFIRITIPSFTIGTTQTVHYTVPLGKIFYASSIMLQYLNDQNQPAEWHLRDGTTPMIPFLAAAKNVGGNAGVTPISPSLPEPLPFTTSVNSIKIGAQGDVDCVIFMIGYIEDV